MKIIDPAALKTPRSPLCEWCGIYTRRETERHHIVSRGMGGGNRLDIPENLIDLGGAFDCGCHDKAQRGEIKQVELWVKVGNRLGKNWQTCKSKVYRLLRKPK